MIAVQAPGFILLFHSDITSDYFPSTGSSYRYNLLKQTIFCSKTDICIDAISFVTGSPAGGVNALKQLTSDLPENLQTSICGSAHDRGHAELLLRILSNAGLLRAIHPGDGHLIEQGVIYLAPPDHYKGIEGQKILTNKGTKENNFRPAIDALGRILV